MPFDQLPGHDIRIPEQRLVVPPAKPVLPYTEYAKILMDAVGGLADELSPAGRARKQAQLAQLQYLKHFYETGGKHDPLVNYKAAELVARTNRANAQAADMARRKNIPAEQTWVGKLREIIAPEHPARAGKGNSGTFGPLTQPTVLPADPSDLLHSLNPNDRAKAEANSDIPDDAPKTTQVEQPLELAPSDDDFSSSIIDDGDVQTDLPPISTDAIV